MHVYKYIYISTHTHVVFIMKDGKRWNELLEKAVKYCSWVGRSPE